MFDRLIDRGASILTIGGDGCEVASSFSESLSEFSIDTIVSMPI
jgi:hypothetical protein